MKWFDNWIARCLQRYQQRQDNYESGPPMSASRYLTTQAGSKRANTNESLRTRGMNFSIHPASGGHVLEYNSYNNKTDEYENTLHLIPSDNDLGQSIGHAITLEMLKK